MREGVADDLVPILEALGAAVAKAAGFFENPAVPRERKVRALRRAVEAVATAGAGSGARAAALAARLAEVLVRRHRVGAIPEIAEAYGEVRDRALGIARVLVETAVPFPDPLRPRLEESLRARVGGPVRVRYEVRPELVAGGRVRIGDLEIDGSVAGYLARAEARLSRIHTSIG